MKKKPELHSTYHQCRCVPALGDEERAIVAKIGLPLLVPPRMLRSEQPEPSRDAFGASHDREDQGERNVFREPPGRSGATVCRKCGRALLDCDCDRIERELPERVHTVSRKKLP